jgi:hypothetical protein
MSLIPLIECHWRERGNPPAGSFPLARRSGASIGRAVQNGKDAGDART